MSLFIMPSKQLKNIAYLSYAHLLLEHAYNAHIKDGGEHFLEGKEQDEATSLMITLKNHLEQKGWFYDNLAKNATTELRIYYNAIDPCVNKHFPKGSEYVPSFLALIMLHRARDWKGLEIPHLSEALTYFVNKMANSKEERSRYYKTVGDIIKRLKIKAKI